MNSTSKTRFHFQRRAVTIAVALALTTSLPITALAGTPALPTPAHITDYGQDNSTDNGTVNSNYGFGPGQNPYVGNPYITTGNSGTTTSTDKYIQNITFNGGNVSDTYDKSGVGTGTLWVYEGGVSQYADGILTVRAGDLNLFSNSAGDAYNPGPSGAVSNDGTLTVQNTGNYATNVYLSGTDPVYSPSGDATSLIDDATGNLGFGEFESGGVVYGTKDATNTTSYANTGEMGADGTNVSSFESLNLGANTSGQITLFNSDVIASYGMGTGTFSDESTKDTGIYGVGGDNIFSIGSTTLSGPATIENLASGGTLAFYGGLSFKAPSLNLLSPEGTTYFQVLGGVTLDNGAGTMTMNSNTVADPGFNVEGNLINQGGDLYGSPAVSGDFTQTSGNAYIDVVPDNTIAEMGANGSGINAGQYDVSGGNIIINAYDSKDTSLSSPFPSGGGFLSPGSGSFANGDMWTILSASGSGTNVFKPANVYYVYNGTQGSEIAGYNPYLTSTGKQVDLCIGSDCVPQKAPAQTQPTEPTKTEPTQPAKTQPAKTAPVQTQPAPVVIPVKVVTPVQETKQTVGNAPHMTIQQARDAQNTIISTGIVGGGPRGFWFKGLGGTQSIGADHGANYGLITGYGFSVGPDVRDVAGVAFSAGQSGLGTGPNNFTRATDYGLWAYGTYYPNASRDWKFSGTIGGGISQNTINSTALGLPQIANFGGSFAGGEVRSSYWTTLDGLTVSPRLSIGYDQSWTNGFQTRGGAFMDVHVARQSSGQFYAEPAVLIGKKFNYRTTSGNHTLFPQVRIGMVENVGPTPSASVSSGQVAGQVQGLSYPHTQGMAELRLDVTSHTRYSKGLSGNISIRQLFGGGASQTEAVAAIKYRW